jgi:hypothetical protein
LSRNSGSAGACKVALIAQHVDRELMQWRHSLSATDDRETALPRLLEEKLVQSNA